MVNLGSETSDHSIILGRDERSLLELGSVCANTEEETSVRRKERDFTAGRMCQAG